MANVVTHKVEKVVVTEEKTVQLTKEEMILVYPLLNKIAGSGAARQVTDNLASVIGSCLNNLPASNHFYLFESGGIRVTSNSDENLKYYLG